MWRFMLVLMVASGCHAKAGEAPPCGTVAGRFFTLAHDDLAKATVDPAARRAVNDQLPAMRDALAVACDTSAWSASVRDCMVKAVDHLGFEACEQQLTDDQRQRLDRAARGDPGSP